MDQIIMQMEGDAAADSIQQDDAAADIIQQDDAASSEQHTQRHDATLQQNQPGLQDYGTHSRILVAQHVHQRMTEQSKHMRHQQTQHKLTQIKQLLQELQQQIEVQSSNRHHAETCCLLNLHVKEQEQLQQRQQRCNQPTLQIQRDQLIQRQQQERNDQMINHSQERVQQNSEHHQQLLQFSLDLAQRQHQYTLQCASSRPPISYGETRASPLSHPPSGYFEILRKIESDATDSLERGDKSKMFCHIRDCKKQHKKKCFCAKHYDLLVPSCRHEYLWGFELMYRGAILFSDIAITVNGITMGFRRPDLWCMNPRSINMFEDDPIEHANRKCLYWLQVATDKHTFETISRNGGGRYAHLLRYLHHNEEANSIPEELIVTFTLLMYYSNFWGFTGDLVVLVSVGPVHLRWMPLIRKYLYTFQRSGLARVICVELSEGESFIPQFNIREHSLPHDLSK